MPAGLIALNQFAFPFISTKKINMVKTRIPMPVQMPTHAGVSWILEIPAMGLVINPKAIYAAPNKISQPKNELLLFCLLIKIYDFKY